MAYLKVKNLAVTASPCTLGLMVDFTVVKSAHISILFNKLAGYTRDRLTEHALAGKAVCLLHMCASFSCNESEMLEIIITSNTFGMNSDNFQRHSEH